MTAATATFDTIVLPADNNTVTLDTSYGGTTTTVNITGDTDSNDTITNSSGSTLIVVAEIEEMQETQFVIPLLIKLKNIIQTIMAIIRPINAEICAPSRKTLTKVPLL